MDSKTYLGTLAEAKVTAELIKQGWYVYQQVGGKGPFDLVAYKDRLLRVSVKGCFKAQSNGSYSIQIGRVRSNKTKNVIHKFNASECDTLAVYLADVDKVGFIPSSDISSGRALCIRTDNKNTGAIQLDQYLVLW